MGVPAGGGGGVFWRSPVVKKNALVRYQPKAVRVHLGGDLVVQKGFGRHVRVVPDDVVGCIVVLVIRHSMCHSEIRHLPAEINVTPQ